jgi:hypothetical protein
MQYTLHIVTGAPGAGKSTALEAFLRLNSDYIALDIDWLTLPASALAGKDVTFERSTWKPYNALWLEILRAVHANGKTAVLFGPLDMQDIQKLGQPAWCNSIEWLLLDSDDETRRRRLSRRPEWTRAMIEEAVEDASVLRQLVRRRVDSSSIPPEAVAVKIREWLQGKFRIKSFELRQSRFKT